MSSTNSCFIFQNKVVYSTMSFFQIDEFENLFHKNSKQVTNGKLTILKIENFRIGIYKNNESSLFIETNDLDLVKSSSKCEVFFETIVNANKYVVETLQQTKADTTESMHNLIHNLRTLNARSLGELEFILPKFKSGINQETNLLINRHLRQNLDKTVTSLIKVYKSTQIMANEFSIFEKTSQQDEINLSNDSHKAHPFLMSVLYAYFSSFYEKAVYIDIQASDLKFCGDYETICSVFHSFFENAVKYSKSNSEIKINFELEDEFIIFYIDMISIEIKANELELLPSTGYRGEIAKKMSKQGEGRGWGIMLKYLSLNNGCIEVTPNYETAKMNSKGDLRYQQNIFKIKLPNCSSNQKAA